MVDDMPALTPCLQQLHEHNRDRFLLSLFVAPAARESVAAIYALETELAHVRRAVREEMIGHIRFAWWQEAIEGLYEGKPARGHPVLEALRPLIAAGYIPKELLLDMVETVREQFPEPAPELAHKTGLAAARLVNILCPNRKKRWKKAGRIIEKHRARHPAANSWLALKLLLA